MTIKTKLAKDLVVKTDFEIDKFCWGTYVLDDNQKLNYDFGMLYTSDFKSVGGNHLKMIKNVLNKKSYFSNLKKLEII